MEDQSTLAALEEVIGRLLLRGSRTAMLEAALRNAPVGLDQATYSVLSGVARLGDVTSAQLAAEIGLDRSGTSRYADRLVAAGLLERSTDDDDGRAAPLRLTRAGRNAIDRARTNLRTHLRRLLAPLSDTDLEATVRTLKHLLGDADR